MGSALWSSSSCWPCLLLDQASGAKRLCSAKCYVTVTSACLNRNVCILLSLIYFLLIPSFSFCLCLPVSRLTGADLCPVCFTSLLRLLPETLSQSLSSTPPSSLSFFSSSCQLGCNERLISPSVVLFFQPGFTAF